MSEHQCTHASGCAPKMGDIFLRGIPERYLRTDPETGKPIILREAFQILGKGMSVKNERLIDKSNEELAAYLTGMMNGKWPHWVGFMHNALTDILSLEIEHTPSQASQKFGDEGWEHCDIYYERPSNKFPQWLQSELASTAQFLIKNGAKAA